MNWTRSPTDAVSASIEPKPVYRDILDAPSNTSSRVCWLARCSPLALGFAGVAHLGGSQIVGLVGNGAIGTVIVYAAFQDNEGYYIPAGHGRGDGRKTRRRRCPG